MEFSPVSRTIGRTQLIDEMIVSFVHNVKVDWLAPSVEPTGLRVTFPLVVVVVFEAGKISHERIYWDQAGVLKQMGVLPDSIEDVSGSEQASLLPTNKLLNYKVQPQNREKNDLQPDPHVSWLQSFSIHTYIGALSVLVYITMAIQGQR